MANNQLEVELSNEISRQRAVIAELRALVRKLLADRDQHVSAIRAAQDAIRALAAVNIEAPSVPSDEPPVNKGFIKNLSEKIAHAGNGQ